MASAKRELCCLATLVSRDEGGVGNGQSCRRRCHRNQRVSNELEKPDVINSDLFVSNGLNVGDHFDDLGRGHLADCFLVSEPVVDFEVREPFQRIIRDRPDNQSYLAE